MTDEIVPAPIALTEDVLRRVPKVALHDHLDGGLRPATVIELAHHAGYTGLPTTDPAELGTWFRDAADECKALLDRAPALPLPAYDQAIKASHIFNLLNARGVISVAERQAYIGRVRELAKGACAAWMAHNGWQP